jgi:hypothetical protein
MNRAETIRQLQVEYARTTTGTSHNTVAKIAGRAYDLGFSEAGNAIAKTIEAATLKVVESERERPPLPAFVPGIYRHFKNKRLYRALFLVRAVNDDHQFMVVYMDVLTKGMYTREWSTEGRSSWTDLVTCRDSGRQIDRFALIESCAPPTV